MAAATVLSLHPSPLSSVPRVELRSGVQVPLADREDYARFLRALSEERLLDLPLAGAGRTLERYERLRDFAAMDLSLGRLIEGHSDAQAILAEAGRSPEPDSLLGVWAADPPHAVLQASEVKGGWHLRGTKSYCSGARVLDRALVTAHSADGVRLFDLDLKQDGIHADPGSWVAVGMAASDSLSVEMDLKVTRDAMVGPPGFYLERPGFWQGSVGVAACWWGGAVGCQEMLRERFTKGAMDEHSAAHFGEVVSDCAAIKAVLTDAAREIDLEGAGDSVAQLRSRERAIRVRSFVEAACQRVLTATGRASGTSPLVFDVAHARRAADLVVYLRQHHAERDLAVLGRLALGKGSGGGVGSRGRT